MSIVPKTNSWDSRMTLQECDEKYYPTVTGIKGVPSEMLPLPAGVPFFIKFLNSTGDSRYNVVGTAEMDAAFEARCKKSVYVMETRRIIPKLGRSVNCHSFPVGALMTISDGNHGRKLYECDEEFKGKKCGGHYRLELDGTYVCDECGIIFEWKEKETTVAKTSYFDDLDLEEFQESMELGDEDTVFVPGMPSIGQNDEELGSTESKEMKFILDRATRNIIEWKKATGQILLEDMPKPKYKPKYIRAVDVYNGKFNELTRRARLAALIHWIKVDGVQDRDDLAKVMGLHKTQVVRLLDDLVKEGRVEYVRTGHKMMAKYVR
jgi:hypothetical protein